MDVMLNLFVVKIANRVNFENPHTMATILHNGLRELARHESIATVIDRTLLRAMTFYRQCRLRSRQFSVTVLEEEKIAGLIKRLNSTCEVIRGPFAGLRYPSADSCGSVLLSKFLGAYESELHPVIEEVIARGCEVVVDVGCAEGYYANGFAMRLPGAQVLAFDVSPKARAACQQMAETNGLAGRLEIGEFCCPQTLIDLQLGPKSLVLADCEGYESALFTPEVIQSLKQSDVLVEMHDFLDVHLSTRLCDAFAPTHDVRIIQSSEDLQRSANFDCPELEGLSFSARGRILTESRPGVMLWAWFRARA